MVTLVTERPTTPRKTAPPVQASRRGPNPAAARPLSRFELRDLPPDPREEWTRLLRFVGWGPADQEAALRSVEPLERAGGDFVAGTYDYLARVPETAAALGWGERVDPAELEERRRFFTVWLMRTLALDTSGEFALYLFRGGQLHAGRGARHADVPSAYVTTSMGLVLASFSQTLLDTRLPVDVAVPALGAWAKYLSVQLHLLLLGDRAARELEQGPRVVRCAVYAHLRPLIGTSVVPVRVGQPATVGDVLRKLLMCYPLLRDELLEREWESRTPENSLWEEEIPVYVLRRGWNVLLNGRDVQHEAGAATPVADADEVEIFPPG